MYFATKGRWDVSFAQSNRVNGVAPKRRKLKSDLILEKWTAVRKKQE